MPRFACVFIMVPDLAWKKLKTKTHPNQNSSLISCSEQKLIIHFVLLFSYLDFD